MNLQRKAWILDVGHGNSTVVEESGYVAVIDGGLGDTLVRFLKDQGFDRIDTVILSHSDADHLGGISLLLSDRDFQVGRVFLNPDRSGSAIWEDFRTVMEDAKLRGAKFDLELTTENPGGIDNDGVRLEILYPTQEMAYRTSGGQGLSGRQLTSNAMSAVVRVWTGDSPRLLLTGDIDKEALDFFTESSVDVRADVLVFPHHGGRPGRSNAEEFAGTLTSMVNAQLVIFSMGRGKYKNPLPEVVAAVLRHSEDVHIACTQLSVHCAKEVPIASSGIHAAISKGLASSACCAGTLEVSLDDEHKYTPDQSSHLEFIQRHAPTALCRRVV